MKQELVDKLKKEHDALTLIQINDLLNLHTAEELKTLQKNLDELIKENKIYLTKKGKDLYLKNCEYLKAGKISINRSGNGFLLLDGDDLYIDYKNLNNAIDDRIPFIPSFVIFYVMWYLFLILIFPFFTAFTFYFQHLYCTKNIVICQLLF